jgi:hypothetical protein
MSVPDDAGDLPPVLGMGAHLQARNTEYNLDLTGRVTHLNEERLITHFPVEIPVGTVLFSVIDLPQINATVRGLIRVESQSEGSEGGFHTIADFVDLNADERGKIARVLGRGIDEFPQTQARGATFADTGAQSQGYVVPSAPAAQHGHDAERRVPVRINVDSVIWIVLAVIFYSMVLLGIIAIFPQGRAVELIWLAKIVHAIDRLWPGFSHLFGSK